MKSASKRHDSGLGEQHLWALGCDLDHFTLPERQAPAFNGRARLWKGRTILSQINDSFEIRVYSSHTGIARAPHAGESSINVVSKITFSCAAGHCDFAAATAIV
jgi:hypothetical protein